ncbi:MAG: adenosylhomocysteinase [Thermoplasmata archaeon]|nr:adenosylhomocysteinase [Candidatus Sysuiplasma jiujiangense]
MPGSGGSTDKDILEKGIRRIEWAKTHMDVLSLTSRRIAERGMLKGLKIAMALHVEAKTACLALALREAGAEVRLASCNPLSTDDSVSSALNGHFGLETHARKGETGEEYYSNLNSVLDIRPDILIDDGADLIAMVHTGRKELLGKIIGGNEETTTGVVRLKAMANEGKLRFPVLAVNDSYMKYLFDNRYGTGQSSFDGIMNATNLLLAGKRTVVAGYGWCGRGIAQRARGMGAIVTVTEIDPVKAVEANMDGFEVSSMDRAIANADFVITATGCRDVVTYDHMLKAKSGCILSNAGHFNLEIDVEALRKKSSGKQVREYVEEHTLENGKKINLLADGRLVNLVAGQGHPAEIMDLSFSLQARGAEFLAENRGRMEPGVHVLPREVDAELARMKLRALGIGIDSLTEVQKNYLSSWTMGT